MILQTSSPKLRERALQDNVNYEDLLKLGTAKEQSEKGAALLEKASDQDPLLNVSHHRRDPLPPIREPKTSLT